MEKSISGFVLYKVVQDLKKLVGKHLSNIQQLDERTFLLSFGSKKIIVELGRRINIATHDIKAPLVPTSLVMFLRKYLRGRRLKDVYQINLDRIVVFDFGEYKLIFEIFGKGNAIFTDGDLNILWALHEREWRARRIFKGEKYTPPPSLKPFDKNTFLERVKEGERGLIELGIPKPYAKILAKSEKPFESFLEMLEKDEPVIEEGEVRTFPFTAEFQRFSSIHEAIDTLYQKRAEDKKKRVLEQMRRTLREYEEKEREAREKGEWIKEHIDQVEKMLLAARKEGKRKVVIEI